MKRSTIMLLLAAAVGVVTGYTIAPTDDIAPIPICFSYHDNKSVETFSIPVNKTCPTGYTYGRGTIANTSELIAILESVAAKNFQNGTAEGK